MAKKVKAGVEITGKDKSVSAFSSLSKSLSTAENKFKRLKIQLSGIGGGLKLTGGILAGAGAAIGGAVAIATTAMIRATNATANYADEVGKFGRQTGFSVEKIQELDFVAKRNGISLEGTRKGIVKFSKVLGDIKNLKTRSQLERIDKGLAKQLKGTKNASEAFDVFLKAVSKTNDPVKRSALAFAVFGKSGQQMLRLLDGGPETFERLREEARKYGILTEEDIKKAEAYKDAQENLQTALGGLRNSLTVGIMPALSGAAQKMADFIAANRPKIVEAMSGLVTSMSTALENLINYLVKNPTALQDFIGNAANGLAAVFKAVRDIKAGISAIRELTGGEGDQEKAIRRTGSQKIVGADPNAPLPGKAKAFFEGYKAGSGGEFTAMERMFSPVPMIAGFREGYRNMLAADVAASKGNVTITVRNESGAAVMVDKEGQAIGTVKIEDNFVNSYVE